MSRLNQQFMLPSGRILGYDEYGLTDGKPVFYFHGTPSSRLEWLLFGNETLAQALNIRIIVPDRPGMGISGFQKGRHISDWPEDVIALADHLHIDRFSILGYSGGGPYAVACSSSIPERLVKVGIISGAGPFDQFGLTDGISKENLRFFNLTREKPWVSRLSLRLMGLMARFAGDKMVSSAMVTLPKADQQIVGRPEIQKGFLNMIREALRHGPQGAYWDTLLMISPWEFRPQNIKAQVQIWHGDADKNVPPAMAQYVADSIPNSCIRFYPSEGHLSLFAKNTEIFLRAIVN